MLDNKYDILSRQLKLQTYDIDALTLTAEVWTHLHNSQCYLGLLGNFIYEIN